MDALPSGTPEQARELGRYIETTSDCHNQQTDSGRQQRPGRSRGGHHRHSPGSRRARRRRQGSVHGLAEHDHSSYLLPKNIKVGRHWKNLNVKISGEIIVELEAVFAMDWYTETGERLGLELELVDDPGADIVPMQLLPSGPGYLTIAGVRIYLYPKPMVLHAKHFTVDDMVGIIGSSNMDYRSFGLDYEITLMSTGKQFVADLQAVADGYRSVCRELTMAEWSQRSRGERYVENVMRLVSALQ